MNASDIDDALYPRLAGSTEGMTLQVLAQIRDSLTAMGRDVRANKDATGDVRERVIRLEERDKRLDAVEATVAVLDARVDVLLKDKDQRNGAMSAYTSIPKIVAFLVALASVFSAIWLAGRSAGIVPPPPVAPVRLEATGNPDDQRIEGTVGGKPKP